jgi:hypothetical protein
MGGTIAGSGPGTREEPREADHSRKDVQNSAGNPMKTHRPTYKTPLAYDLFIPFSPYTLPHFLNWKNHPVSFPFSQSIKFWV